MTSAALPLSGAQHRIRSGAYEAVIASTGASLRELRHDGRDLIVPFGADEVRPDYRGATLAPWPNRIVDGTYAFEGEDIVTALTEPERSHALHGLVSWADFEQVAASDDSVTLATTIAPQSGYPWRVRVETTYALGADGLTQTVRARNLSARPAPFGTGPHPYLQAGPAPLDEWTLALPAASVLEVTPDRLSPVALRAVAEHDADRFDRREPRPLGAVQLDHAFTDLETDAGGAAVLRLTDPSGVGVEVTWGAECPWVQVYTGDKPEGPANPDHRNGVAVEPMTCAPDAFNAASYDYDAGLLVLEPGAEFSASWRIAAI
ncbi:aldose 1-epimerase family protein [Microbacterium sp. EYE_5]|uniref:aldose 1-epimerase family protein n=1 Tax=unclassified Microbacterium TaxID=2609290 RepID=UPI0020039CA2|nr:MULTISPECIES: aldose 1-epimerase family protein [unclassified Microbacterium]MCK6080035.1 aldose 1-epimerase family protein [Microbacterium sp. EYE_382]MCK6085306.1 aldose 1-epimerase family protein [Microbacterium sp. EYE_384]MCK6122469.1 aldose 1-epimerase family protein [Microbacterium sp. EYE_80]MCK6126069.1 aldose 1-epimerase family protein [Microbacterium sp. EYE_79]MCK6140990.1 aldose 1-epimerase family protein [Microbacterium sp. EYE_39]